MITHATSPQLLASASIYVQDHEHKLFKCRALLDTCATANFISESLVKRLNLPVTAQLLPVGSINTLNTVSREIVQITLQSVYNGFRKNLICLTIPSIAELIPSEIFPRNTVKIPANIRLADPKFHIPQPIDILIGSGATISLFSVGQINLSHEKGDLYLQKTRLGWIVVGSGSTPREQQRATCCLTTLESQLSKFWVIEEISADKPKSIEESECEAHFLKNVTRENNGRYTVRLPFRKDSRRLGDSRAIALKRLLSLERALDAKPAFKLEYTRILEEYLTLGHMSPVENDDESGYYMPHHAVMKQSSNTTKVRIVFDASAATSNGVSLNDVLMVGPTMQDTLFAHLIRFRSYKYVITADIEKMYRQVLVHGDDRRFQRILWRINNEIKTFQLNTLTFGVSSSPFLAIRTVLELANDEREAYPTAAEVIKNHLYVDDLLSGANSVKEARAIRDEVIALLARGGFAIKQWASNNIHIINDLNTGMKHANFAFKMDSSLKTLGITWNTRDDKIYYTINPIKITEKLTKRNLLSEIARIFDPLGLLGPIILYAKKLMQDIWRSGLNWDESVPQTIYTEWSEFVRQLDVIEQFSFDRKLLEDDYRDVQIHGFCDASNVGYGAVLYVRSVGRQNNVRTQVLCAKSRVAPLKTITIPRLELCGALLLARLVHEVKGVLNIASGKTIYWSDSTIVLHWVKTSPHLLKTYIANRVAEIQKLTNSYDWRHVRSEDNPADALSRGQMPHAFSRNRSWLTGPTWLTKDEGEWPNEVIRTIKIPELKGNICLTTTINNFEILEKCSSYSRLLRIVAYCLRFARTNKYNGSLCAKEINEAEIRILKLLQSICFQDEIKRLGNKDGINKGKIANLNPFLDKNGLIRVGGRLKRSDLTFSQKHPILLPNRHIITNNIIREMHEKHFHAGIQTTLYVIRQRFWLLDGRNQVRKIVRSCTRCFRFNAIPIEYKMGDLPQARVREAIPFINTGIDFCGPFYIKEKKYRNRTRIKVYVCVFVCMSIKALHLEVVSDLTTDGFLAALRRFIARRGMPAHIYSDNGTNFVGANNQLKEIYALFNSDEHKNSVGRFASDHRITWHFIPPLAPHFGGLWESMVKLFKHHLKRVIGDSLFTFEELNTFVIEIEGILNSRPVTPISSDPNDLLVLTPAHYLIGKPLTTLPESQLSSVPVNRLSSWQHITKVRQDFWARWNLEYLNELQKRSKWIKDDPSLTMGTIVLIKERNLPCTQWALGRISKLHAGEDGVTRAATVKTSNGEIKRVTTLLCSLPIE